MQAAWISGSLSRWRTVSRPWTRRWRTFAGLVPLSWGGTLLMLGLVGFFWYFGLVEQDHVLALACACVFLVGWLALALTTEAALAVHRRWKRARTDGAGEGKRQWMAGTPGWVPLGMALPRRPFVDLGWSWVEPAEASVELHKGEGGLAEMVTFAHRCLVTKVERRFEVRDVLGFGSIRWNKRQAVNLEVLPAPVPIDQATLVHSLCSGDDLPDPYGEPVGDRVDMRRYAAGDPPRLILWKVFARTRKLMVRIPERAFSPTPRTCAYLVAGPHDETVAGLLRSVLESGLLGSGWRFGADGNGESTARLDEALTFLARSGNEGSRGETGLGAFLERARQDGYQSCLVGVPAAVGPWMAEVQAAVRQSGLMINFLAASDGPKGKTSLEGRLGKLLLQPKSRLSVGEPETVLRQLQQGAGRRLLYHRSTGQVVPV